MLETATVIEIPDARATQFDHGAFDPKTRRVFVAHTAPDCVEVLAHDLGEVAHWKLPAAGAHGLDIERQGDRLYFVCDGAALVEMDASTGRVLREWPLAGVPDATFFNPDSGSVHVAIEDRGLVQSIHPGSGVRAEFKTGQGAKTTALVAPRHIYLVSPPHHGALVLSDLGAGP